MEWRLGLGESLTGDSRVYRNAVASGYLPGMILTRFLQVADAESLKDSLELVVAIECGSG